MKYIIFYNECLRSKLIYYNFIKKNSKNIKCVIEIPINNNNNKFFLIKKGILNNNAHSFIFYQLFQTIFYNLFSSIFSSNIRSMCKRLNISFKKNDNVLVIDDLIATGGTAEAAAKLIEISGGKVSCFVFVINLFDLNGCDNLIKK